MEDLKAKMRKELWPNKALATWMDRPNWSHHLGHLSHFVEREREREEEEEEKKKKRKEKKRNKEKLKKGMESIELV